MDKAFGNIFHSNSPIVLPVVSNSLSLKENIQLLLWSIKVLRLTHLEDVMSFMKKGDVIEAYTLDGVQIYRNQVMEQLCSYSKSAFSEKAFNQLFERNYLIDQKIFARVGQIASDPPETTVPWGIEDHDLREIDSLKKRIFRIKLGVISPLFSEDGSVYGFISTLRATLVAEGKDSDFLHFL